MSERTDSDIGTLFEQNKQEPDTSAQTKSQLQEPQVCELTGAYIKGLHALGHVIREGGLAGAGRRMSLSEPAVSRLITGLEQSCGLELFNRDKRSLVPTPAGIRFYSEAQRILDNLNRIGSLADDIRRGQEEFLRIIVMPRLMEGLAVPAIAKLAEESPRTHISIDSKARDDGDIWMNNQVYDLGLGALPIFHPKIETEELIRVPAKCVMAKDHALAKNAIIRPIDVVAERMIMLPSQSIPRIETEQWFRNASLQLCHSIEVNCPVTVLNLVSKNAGISFVDDLWLGNNRSDQLTVRPLEKPFWLSYGLMWYVNQRQRKDSANKFARIAREFAENHYSRKS